MNAKPVWVLWTGTGEETKQRGVYLSLEKAVNGGHILKSSGIASYVEEMVDFDLGKIVWSSEKG